MAVIGTFGQFGTARLAIYASQASLTVTGNNIANINTDGYTRQRMDLVSLYSTGQGKYANIFNTNVGYGVLTNGVTRLRDPYLDIRYRNENTKLNASDEKRDGLYQISNILDEVGKGTENTDTEGFGVIEAQFGKFIDSLNAGLDVNVGSEEYDKLVRSAAETLTAYFRKAASDLEDIKVNKANELVESVAEINNLLTNIRDLNSQIRTQGIYGEQAPELRDARDLALDKLSGYIPIDVTYSMERIDQFTEVEKLTVTIKNSKGPDGQPIKLVDGIYGGQITIPGRMPVLNENANAQKIIDAMNTARDDIMNMDLTADASKNTLKQWALDKKPTGGGMYPDQAALDAAIKESQDKYVNEVLAEYKLDNDTDAEVDAKITDPVKNAEAKAAIKAAKDKGEQKILRRIQTQYAEAEAEKAKDAATAQYGKYVLKDGTITDNWDAATRAPNPDDPTDPGEGYFNFDEKNMIDPDSLYLMRVEELVDQRGRLMEDRKTVSGKSEIVALDDVTFCAKAADRVNDATRVDSNALGSLQAIREMLTREGEYSSKDDFDRDEYTGIKRGIKYYEKALDNLAQKFAEVFNEMNQLPASTVYTTKNDDFIQNGNDTAVFVDKDGNELKLTLEDGTTKDITVDMVTEVVKDKDGNDVRVPKTTDEAVKALEVLRQNAGLNKGYEYYDGGVLISNRGDNNDPKGITAANISVSQAWSNHSVRVLNTKQKFEVSGDGTVTDHSTIRDNISHMITEFDKKRDYMASDVTDDPVATLPVFHGSFREVFTAISGVLADDYSETISKTENYTISALSLENDRQSVSGVDLNDEATNMMQFSKSYAAACRLLTTIDSMLDTLINGTAR